MSSIELGDRVELLLARLVEAASASSAPLDLSLSGSSFVAPSGGADLMEIEGSDVSTLLAARLRAEGFDALADLASAMVEAGKQLESEDAEDGSVSDLVYVMY